MPPLSPGSSAQLRLLNLNDPDFIRISKLFLTGWRHAQKYRPVIQHIYEVKLPPSLVETYCAYRADDYTSNYWASQYKVMLVARVMLGRGFKLQLTTTDLKGPPKGYHSVIGEVGLSLNYDEQVVFKDEAIRPAYVIVYRQ
ncbi:hypothetical protein FRC04_011834 [Tulasnella sp. 424]|nr:hypothetical protein FRC04_011834 [Tulasnella sp. 424]